MESDRFVVTPTMCIVGHAGSDPHDGYNHATRIRELVEAIGLISYD